MLSSNILSQPEMLNQGFSDSMNMFIESVYNLYSLELMNFRNLENNSNHIPDAQVPDIKVWRQEFKSIDDLISYHQEEASKSFYFYILDKTKYITYEEIIKGLQLEQEVYDQLIAKINPNEKIEYSFSLYCFRFRNVEDHCRCNVNFTLDKKNIKFLPNGSISDITYKRSSYNNEHNHRLLEDDKFKDSYGMLQFLELDLVHFGSNSKVNDIFTFAQNKYNITLKYNYP